MHLDRPACAYSKNKHLSISHSNDDRLSNSDGNRNETLEVLALQNHFQPKPTRQSGVPACRKRLKESIGFCTKSS
ncbi:MAG: hypothetical protein WD048_07135 [Chitinophagales bacterium]